MPLGLFLSHLVLWGGSTQGLVRTLWVTLLVVPGLRTLSQADSWDFEMAW